MVFKVKDDKVYIGRKYIREANDVELELCEEIEKYKAEQIDLLRAFDKLNRSLDKLIKAGQ